MQKNKKKGVWVIYNIIPFHQSHLLPDILLEPQRDSEGQAKEKRRKTSKSTTCPFYKPGPMENFRDLALVCLVNVSAPD